MRDKEVNKLIQASTHAAENQVEHVLIIKHPSRYPAQWIDKTLY